VLSGEVTREDCTLSVADARESPRAGCFAADGAALDEASRSFGSSKGFMLELGVSTEVGDRETLELVGVCFERVCVSKEEGEFLPKSGLFRDTLRS
jgi:hypothetical protein